VRAIVKGILTECLAAISQNACISIAAHYNQISEHHAKKASDDRFNPILEADLSFVRSCSRDLCQVFEGTKVERLIRTCPTARELSKDDRKRLAIEASPKSGVEHTNPSEMSTKKGDGFVLEAKCVPS
jgi:hypothetical protein